MNKIISVDKSFLDACDKSFLEAWKQLAGVAQTELNADKVKNEEIKAKNSINEPLKREARLLVDKWISTTAYLNNILDINKQMTIAVLLENQKLINEAFHRSEMIDKTIPLTAKVFSSLKAWNWVTIQPLMGSTGLIYNLRTREENVVIESEEVGAVPRTFNRVFGDDYGVNDVTPHIAEDIDNEILRDLWLNCGSVRQLNMTYAEKDKKPKRFREQILLLRDDLQEKCKIHEPNFLVINPKFKEFNDAIINLGLSIEYHEGITGVLMGYKQLDHEFLNHAGYTYCPYIPFSFAAYLDGNLDARYKVTTRYGKKMARNGAIFYGRVEVTN
jgi:hypothetical protein